MNIQERKNRVLSELSKLSPVLVVELTYEGVFGAARVTDVAWGREYLWDRNIHVPPELLGEIKGLALDIVEHLYPGWIGEGHNGGEGKVEFVVDHMTYNNVYVTHTDIYLARHCHSKRSV